MTEFKKIFLDTSPIVYYLENSDYITSTVTMTEYLTYPYQQNNLRLINAFYDFIDGMEIEVRNIDKIIAKKAAQIRAKYRFFKTMDALQLATACLSGCDLFLTNDRQLKQFTEIECILVAELE